MTAEQAARRIIICSRTDVSQWICPHGSLVEPLKVGRDFVDPHGPHGEHRAYRVVGTTRCAQCHKACRPLTATEIELA